MHCRISLELFTLGATKPKFLKIISGVPVLFSAVFRFSSAIEKNNGIIFGVRGWSFFFL
jgi:hypothetical protein